ncbi:c-type cytochrome [Psychroserpens sp. Hel_I_66]|uniref:c-type cytochrome n=1 Tax=Psychroserpens sp. Hel_I_66 TaxID=1250004 RepID=UPI000648F68F|nr:cytochrome c [Psychroserpens sp. Hel_I_66]
MKLNITLLIAVSMLVSCNSSEKKREYSEANISEVNSKQQDPELKKSMDRGKDIYTGFCVSCHMPNGEGVPRAFPPLAKSDYLMNKREESIKAIKYGQSGKIVVNGKTYNSVMSPLGLNDDEVADVMNYITNSWGNSNDKLVTKSEVSAIER